MTSRSEDALKELASYRDKISATLNDYFDSDLAKESIRFTTHGRQTYELVREFSTREGKRIRGSLTMATHVMFGGQPDSRAALEAAVAIELIQNYLLIIDDVMDRSVARRNGPTLHVQYYKQAKDIMSPNEAKHYSDMLAVNAGLIVQHMAMEIIAQLDIDAEIIKKASALVHKNIITTGYGQIEDLYNNAIHDANEQDILRLHKQKTSYYTFINPTQLGATLANADESVLKILEEYGVNAGIAFQLHDDIIGLFGSQSDTGKSVLDDLKEGKMTLLIRKAYDEANEQQKKIIEQALGNSKLSAKQHEQVKKIVEQTGSLAYSNQLKQHYADRAIELIERQSWQKSGRDFLIGLVEYSVNRTK